MFILIQDKVIFYLCYLLNLKFRIIYFYVQINNLNFYFAITCYSMNSFFKVFKEKNEPIYVPL